MFTILGCEDSKTDQKCFSFRGAKAWNNLAAEGKLAESLNPILALKNANSI